MKTAENGSKTTKFLCRTQKPCAAQNGVLCGTNTQKRGKGERFRRFAKIQKFHFQNFEARENFQIKNFRSFEASPIGIDFDLCRTRGRLCRDCAAQKSHFTLCFRCCAACAAQIPTYAYLLRKKVKSKYIYSDRAYGAQREYWG